MLCGYLEFTDRVATVNSQLICSVSPNLTKNSFKIENYLKRVRVYDKRVR